MSVFTNGPKAKQQSATGFMDESDHATVMFMADGRGIQAHALAADSSSPHQLAGIGESKSSLWRWVPSGRPVHMRCWRPSARVCGRRRVVRPVRSRPAARIRFSAVRPVASTEIHPFSMCAAVVCRSSSSTCRRLAGGDHGIELTKYRPLVEHHHRRVVVLFTWAIVVSGMKSI